jgi:CheY-like chemotaxis protein
MSRADRRKVRRAATKGAVLIVDDERGLAETTGAVLEAEGWRVVIASDGREGLARLVDREIAIVLTDLVMPRMDGRALCRAMRRDRRLRAIPIVCLTATPGVVPLDCRFDAVLHKPIAIAPLLEIVTRLSGAPDDDDDRDWPRDDDWELDDERRDDDELRCDDAT